MAGIAYAIAERHDRVNRLEGIAIAAAAFIPPVFLSWAFPEGGWAPFRPPRTSRSRCSRSLARVVLPRREATLRWGVLLYGLGATLALAIETPMGGNAVRLGALRRPRPARAPSGGSPGCAGSGRFHARCPARTARLLAVVARAAT